MFPPSKLMFAAILPGATTGEVAKYSEPSRPCSSAPTKSSMIDRRGATASDANALPTESTMPTPVALSMAPL